MAYVAFKLDGGLRTDAEDVSIPDNCLTRAIACGYETGGALTSARGRDLISTPAPEEAIEGLFSGVRGGTRYRYCKAGTAVYENTTSVGGTWTGDTLSGFSYNGYIYLTDGAVQKRWDGTTLAPWGIAAPTVAPTLSAGTSSNMTAGDYKYVYTWYNGVAESNFSPSQTVTVAASGKVTLSAFETAPTGVTHIRIYRTDVNGSAFFYITQIAVGTSSYEDTGALPASADTASTPGDAITTVRNSTDNSAGTEATIEQQRKASSYKPGTLLWQLERMTSKNAGRREAPEVVLTNLGYLAEWNDHDAPPSNLKHVLVLNEQVFGISGNSVVFSLTGQPEHFPIYNQFYPGRNSSETTQAILAHDRDLIVYTDAGLYRFSAIGLSFEDPRLEEIDSPVGLAAEWAVAPLDGMRGHVFLADTGLYLFDGVKVQEVGQAVTALFYDSDNPDYVNPAYISSAWMVSCRNMVYLSYGTNAANDHLLIADLNDVANPRFTTMTEISAACLYHERDSNTVISGTDEGSIYQLDVGWTNDGEQLTWAWQTKQFALAGQGAAFNVDELVLDGDFGDSQLAVLVTMRGRGATKQAQFFVNADGRQRVKKKLPQDFRGETIQVYGASLLNSANPGKRVLYSIGFTTQGEDEP